MAKASFSYEVDFDGSKVGLVNTLDLSEPTDELEEELEAELEDELEDELVDAEIDELVGALLLAELAMEPALGDEALPPHAVRAKIIVIEAIITISFLFITLPPLYHQQIRSPP